MLPQASWSELARPGSAPVRDQSSLLMMCSPAAMPILGDSHDRRPSSTFHDLGRLGGIVVRGRTHDPPFLKLIFGLRERVISRGLFFSGLPGRTGCGMKT